MARLIIPAVIVFFYFSLLLSSSQAGHPVTSTEDHVTDLPSANFNEEDVTDFKPLIALPTSNLLNSDDVSSVNVEKNRPDSENFAGEFQEVDTQAMKSFDDGEKRLEEFHPTANWGPMNRRFERMRGIRCRHRHRGPRFGGGAQIRPQMPFWKEHDEHHHGDIFPARKFDEPRFHEADPARFADVSGDGRMIGEFKQPHFFFRHHHHHHHRHHHGDDEDRFAHGEEEEIEEEREHHRHRRGHGLWMRIRKFLGPF